MFDKSKLLFLIVASLIIFNSIYGVISGAGAVNSSLLVQHDNLHPDQDKAIEDTLDKLRAQPAPVMAIIPGAGR